MKRRHVRCFWSWPVGHRWERVVEHGYAYKRCPECWKTTALSTNRERPPHQFYGDGGD